MKKNMCHFNDPDDKKYEKVWKKFKRIEEFDPVDI